MTVDSNGVLWFPAIIPPDETGKQENRLFGYDPASESVRTFPLPADEGSAFSARVEAGTGLRDGKIIVAWESTLLEVDSATGELTRLAAPVDPAKIVTGPEPATTLIYDIAVAQDATIWVSRDHYPYLTAVYPDGSANDFALPKEAGSPERLAVDENGLIWATLIRHQPVQVEPDGPAINAYRYTLRFDPATGLSEVLPVAAWNIAGARGTVVAMAGDIPGPLYRLDATGTSTVTPRDFGPASPGDEMAIGASAEIWYHSRSIHGLIRVVRGDAVAFPLPTTTDVVDNSFGGLRCRDKCGTPSAPPRSDTSVLAIAVAPDGSAWFSAGNRIGHAVP